jgi:hypothetical protein|tara:strand:- start:1967 stop:2959 length:993 start_codon:yes stop_codon:yes gene_type:complete
MYKYNFINQLLCLGSKKLELTPKELVLTSKRLWIFTHEFKLFWGLGWLANLLRGEHKFLNINKIIYFDKNRSITGIKISTGYKAGGGDDNNINFILNKNSEIEFIEQHILEHGGKLGGSGIEGEKIKTTFPLTNPKRWLSYREIIVIGNDGIGHTKKSWFKTRNSFVPYKSIKLFAFNGLLSKKINILGDTSIFSTEGMSNSNFKKIKEKLAQFNLSSEKGRFYKPAILSGKRGFNSSYYLLSEDGLYCKQKKLIGDSDIQFLPYENITSYDREGWFKLFSPVYIQGTRTDARKGEGGNIKMTVEGISFHRWKYLLFFNGSLRRTIKSKS